MSEKQCGTCKWWDRNNIRLIDTAVRDQKISDCLSLNNESDSFVVTGLDDTLEKYPMLFIEGQDCLGYEERK